MAPARGKSVQTRREPRPAAAAAGYVPDDAWLALSTRSNLLLIGTATRVEDVIAGVYADLPLPRLMWAPDRELRLPRRASGTLLLRDVDHLPLGDQLRLDQWLTTVQRRPQVISTSLRSLYNLIDSGAFLESLYYRLNTVTIPVDDE